jgi:hypothetical protein
MYKVILLLTDNYHSPTIRQFYIIAGGYWIRIEFRDNNIFNYRRSNPMNKISTVLFLMVLVASWTYPCQASEMVYFAPDGSKITKAEYDRQAAEKADAYQRAKKAWRSKPFKRSRRPAAGSGQKGKFSEIRKSDIRNISKKMIKAAGDGDLNGMTSYLAPSFRVTLDTAQGRLSLTRAEYVALLNQAWSSIQTYEMSIENQKITVAADKQKATNEVTMIESTTLTNGASMKIRSLQKSIYEIVDGRILITRTQTREEML